MSPQPAVKPTILVVDDTPENIEVLCGILGADYTMQVAGNGQLALKIIAARAPDLILLDVMMPGIDGHEVCRQLKADSRTCDIPVIFITAKTESEDEVQGLSLGAVDYLTKPVVPSIVKARVSAHLALQQARRELEQKNLALRQAHLELEEKNLILSDEKELLEDIVTRMRSASPFDERKVRHIGKLLERTGGDIVLSSCRPDGAQHVLVGDFSGHGLPAAFAGPLVSYIFYHRTAEGCSMRHILEEINRILYRQLPTQLYMAAGALELSPDRKQAMAWNCGLPPALCLSAMRETIRVNSSGLPLGLSEAIDTYEPHAQIEIEPDMRIYLYSDGITEAKSVDRRLYGQERLEALVSRIYREHLPLEIIWQELDAYCGGRGLSDDAVMIEISP